MASKPVLGFCCVAGAGGKYCPDTTSMLDCQPGHFCKSGSSKMLPCPPLLGCPANTESPTDNWLGFALDGALFLLLALTWQATQLYNQLMRRLSSKERMKILWNSKAIAPEVCVFAASMARCNCIASTPCLIVCHRSRPHTARESQQLPCTWCCCCCSIETAFALAGAVTLSSEVLYLTTESTSSTFNPLAGW